MAVSGAVKGTAQALPTLADAGTQEESMGGTQAWKGTGKHPRPETAYAFSYEPPDFLRS